MSKLSISKAWEASRDVIGRNGSLLATVALALLVLPGVVSDMAKPATDGAAFPEPGPWLIVAAIAFIIGLIGQLAIVTQALGSRRTVAEAIGHGMRRAPSYVAATFIWTAPFALLMYAMARGAGTPPSGGVVLGLLPLLIVFLYLCVRMILTPAVATAESGGPLHIIKRSWALTSGNWWRLFGFVVVWAIAAMVVLLAVQAIGGLLSGMIFGDSEPMTVGGLVVSVLTRLAGAALTVVLVVMQARLYLQVAAAAEPEVTVPSSGT